MKGMSQGFFLLAIVYTADPSVVKHNRENPQMLLLPLGEIPNY